MVCPLRLVRTALSCRFIAGSPRVKKISWSLYKHIEIILGQQFVD